MYANNKMSWWLYLVGIFIVIGSHIYMLALGGLPLEQMGAHAIANIVAGLLIMAGWLTRQA